MESETNHPIDINNYEVKETIGEGTYGKVIKVIKKNTDEANSGNEDNSENGSYAKKIYKIPLSQIVHDKT